jgi:hypothetical protein
MDITALSQITNVATALSNLILVSPQKVQGYQPQSLANPNGQPQYSQPALLFHYEGENTVHLQSDITDHYVEDNTALQDQISRKPEEISVHGFIGELNDFDGTIYGVPGALQIAKTVADKLTTISAYTPSLSATALIAYNNALQLYQVTTNTANAAVNAWASIIGGGAGGESVIGSAGLQSLPNQTIQQLMFQQFYGYWQNLTLFTVQTPWAIFQNMAIKDLTSIQDDKTSMITDFNITFKMIRIAKTQSTSLIASNSQGRLFAQASPNVNNGTSSPAASITSQSALASAYPSLGVA